MIFLVKETRIINREKGYEFIQENDTGRTLAIHRATGTVLDTVNVTLPVGSKIYTPEQQEAYRRYKAIKEHSNALGRFFFAHQRETFTHISPESATRLIYLNTFAGFNSNQLMRTTRTPLKYTDLPKVLGLSVSTVSRFLKEVSPDYIEIDEEGRIFTNRDIFIRGRLTSNGEPFQKIYINNVRRLYQGVPRRRDRQLGYIFKLLPYINVEYNLLCTNPMETILEEVDLISVADFCDMVGYDVRHVNKLLKIYSNLLFEVDGRMERFCAIAYDGVTKEEARILVNPHILYSGKDYSRVEILGAFCVD